MVELPEYILYCSNLEDAESVCLILLDNGVAFYFRKLYNGGFEVMIFGYMAVEIRDSIKKYGKLEEIIMFRSF